MSGFESWAWDVETDKEEKEASKIAQITRKLGMAFGMAGLRIRFIINRRKIIKYNFTL